jgi:hypothetical protein
MRALWLLVAISACDHSASAPPHDAGVIVDADASVDAPPDARGDQCLTRADCGSQLCCILCSPGMACFNSECSGYPTTWCNYSLCDPMATEPCIKGSGETGTCEYTKISWYSNRMYWTCQ